MALVIKGVYDFTRYVFNGILHVILRDLTNYYWYLEEEQKDDTAVEIQTGNDGVLLLSNLNDECNYLGSNQENIGPEFVNNNKHEDGSMPNEILCVLDSLCSLNIQDETPENLDEMSIEDNSIIQNEEDNFNSTYPITTHSIWTGIENYFCDNKNVINDDKNIIEEKSPQISLETMEREGMTNTLPENLGVGVDLGEKLILQTNYKDVYDETNSKITSVKTPEKEHGLKIYQTEENLLNNDNERFISELQNNEKSDESSERGLGLHNFQCRNLHDKWPILEKSDSISQMNETCQSQLGKSKVSRYIHNTTLPSIKTTEQSCTVGEISTLKLPTNSSLEETENEHFLPLTSQESDDNVTMKSKHLQDKSSETSCTPEGEGAYSNDSWEDWFSRFSTIIGSKITTKTDDDSSIKPSSSTEEDEKEDFCDCINSHSCLLDVDSDVDLAKDLLTSEQLGSVETGSVSDWLYRVSPPYPLLPTTKQSEETLHKIPNTEEQEQNTNTQSEISEEDLAVKKFFIEQWLDKTETYNNTGLSARLIGSGDIIWG